MYLERNFDMTKPHPVLCRDCKFSRTTIDYVYSLKCIHPIVNSKDADILGADNTYRAGTKCISERKREWFSPKNGTWFSQCGMRGALWEPKETPQHILAPKLTPVV